MDCVICDKGQLEKKEKLHDLEYNHLDHKEHGVHKNVVLQYYLCDHCGGEFVDMVLAKENKHYMQYRREQQKLADRLKEENPETYLEVKVLQDNSIAMLVRLAFTDAVCLGTSKSTAFESRFCFKNRDLAKEHFDNLKSQDDELTGYTARRPKPQEN